jgi:hypothetical protein
MRCASDEAVESSDSTRGRSILVGQCH